MDRYNIKTPTMNESFSPPLKVVRKIQRRNILKKTKIQKKVNCVLILINYFFLFLF